MQDIKELTLQELENRLENFGVKKYHAKQIFSWIYKKLTLDFAQMSDLPKGLRDKLNAHFFISGLEIARKIKSNDGTKKLLLKLADANFIEAVIIPVNQRLTACVSTQVGCKFACRFCASGMNGFKRNLSCAEILDELLLLEKEVYPERLTNLVFMGTGEPLDNYEEVLKSAKIINSSVGFNMGARRISISTSGIIPGILRLAGEGLQIELSVSLHAADDKLRSELMPVNKRYPLKELIASCKAYSDKTNRQVTFEYILIKGMNSDLKNAQLLVRLLSGYKLSKVNLIPSNPVSGLGLEPPDKKNILLFKDYLFKQGVNVTLRRERGQDIDAACGQLRLKYEKN